MQNERSNQQHRVILAFCVSTSLNAGFPVLSGTERDDGTLKASFPAIGLLNRLCGLDLVAIDELITVHEGGLAEQFIGQQLLCAPPVFEDPQLFYWAREARNSNAEVDFVVSRHQDILPVEVKAGKTGTLRSAYQFLRDKGRRRAMRFHAGMPALEEVKIPGEGKTTVQLLSLPLYAVGQLDRLLKSAFGHR